MTDGQDADGERDAAADQDAGQEVAAVAVGAEQEADADDVGDHGAALAVGGQVLDAGIVEQVGAVDVAHDARIDRLLGRDRRADGEPVDRHLACRDASPAASALSNSGSDRFGLRIGFEARRHAHILRIDAVVGDAARSTGRPIAASASSHEHERAGHRGAVAPAAARQASCQSERPTTASACGTALRQGIACLSHGGLLSRT